MGIYHNKILPYIFDRTMASPITMDLRKELLSVVKGKVIEIGFGTGLNLSSYTSKVTELHAVEPNPGMSRRANGRIAGSGIKVTIKKLWSENLPHENNTFDSAVSTWTMCSIADLPKALSEIKRVLKPAGKLYFIEHGTSPDKNVEKWQNRLTPLQKKIADGCHLNRDIKSYIINAGFKLIEYDEFYQQKVPKLAGYTYKGIAGKAGVGLVDG